MEEVFVQISTERYLQDKKWGANRDLPPKTWLTILIEEVGEVAQAILMGNREKAYGELVQCAAVLVAWMENEHRRDSPTSEGE